MDLNRPHSLLTKHDGSLVSPVLVEDGKNIKFATKSGFGVVSDVIEERYLSIPENKKFFEFSRLWMDQGYTPLFEWCSRRHKVLLDYETDMLILIGIRHNTKVCCLYLFFDRVLTSQKGHYVKVIPHI